MERIIGRYMYSRLVDARRLPAESSRSASVESHPRSLVMRESQSRNKPAIVVHVSVNSTELPESQKFMFFFFKEAKSKRSAKNSYQVLPFYVRHLFNDGP